MRMISALVTVIMIGQVSVGLPQQLSGRKYPEQVSCPSQVQPMARHAPTEDSFRIDISLTHLAFEETTIETEIAEVQPEEVRKSPLWGRTRPPERNHGWSAVSILGYQRFFCFLDQSDHSVVLLGAVVFIKPQPGECDGIMGFLALSLSAVSSLSL